MKENFDYEDLFLKLKTMKFSGMAEELEQQVKDPNCEFLSFEERITRLIEAEWQLRYHKKFARYLKKATLRYLDASLDETLHDPQRSLDIATIEGLIDCNWIAEGRNLLITGNAGTGKSYLACALAINALKQFKSVRYAKTSSMIYELESAVLKNEYLDYIGKLSKLDLLILDDFGMMDLNPDMCRNLFELIDAREGRRSIIVISQLPISSWYTLFKDNTYADSCMDRLVHKAFRLEFHGKNMRNPQL